MVQTERRPARPPWPTRVFIDWPVLDWLLTGAALGLTYWLSSHPSVLGHEVQWHIGWLRNLEAGTRRAVYQTMTTLSGTLLGLTLTSVSILANLMKQDLSTATGGLLTPHRQKRISGLFFAGLRGLAIALLGSLVLLVADSDRVVGARLDQAIAFAILTLATCRLGRIIWVLSLVLSVSVAPAATVPVVHPRISDDEY